MANDWGALTKTVSGRSTKAAGRKTDRFETIDESGDDFENDDDGNSNSLGVVSDALTTGNRSRHKGKSHAGNATEEDFEDNVDVQRPKRGRGSRARWSLFWYTWG